MSKLNPPKPNSNMFAKFHTVNPVTGCTNECLYCYLIHSEYVHSMALKFHEERLDAWGSKPKKVFVGSGGDMWLSQIPSEWIDKTLAHCKKYREFLFLFMSKNPGKYLHSLKQHRFPRRTILGTTIETNRPTKDISHAVNPDLRLDMMVSLKPYLYEGIETLVNIEPVLKFDHDEFVGMMDVLSPDHISIGSDTQKTNLPEPTSIEVLRLLKSLREIADIRIKHNLYRLVRRRLSIDQWHDWLGNNGIQPIGTEIGEPIEEAEPEIQQLTLFAI